MSVIVTTGIFCPHLELLYFRPQSKPCLQYHTWVNGCIRYSNSSSFQWSKVLAPLFLIPTRLLLTHSNTDQLNLLRCGTGFDSDDQSNSRENSDWKSSLSLKFAIEITSITPYTGVVFSFMWSLSLDRYHFNFLMILNEMLAFLSLSNPVLQYLAFPAT